jgi:hypothetical protein
LINSALKTGKRGQKTELTGRSPSRRRRSATDCGAIDEEKEEKEEEEEEEEEAEEEERRYKPHTVTRLTEK